MRLWAPRWYRSVLVLGLVALAGFAIGWVTQAVAGPPSAINELFGKPKQANDSSAQPAAKPAEPVAPSGPESSPEYRSRVVARIYGNVDITREELGEYLIARQGAGMLENLVNHRIIEHACREKGIEVTVPEVEAALDQDCADLGVDRKTFVQQVLRQYKKTLYEWKEDVVRPRLLMTKLCRDRVQVSEEELHQVFESHYGEKVDVRILLYDKKDPKTAFKVFEQVRNDDAAFEHAARTQPTAQLAAKGGEVLPVSHFSGAERVEKVAFSLQPGEVSQVLDVPEGLLIMKCVKRVPPDRTKIFENEREAMKREVVDKKTQLEIGKVFKELSDQAQPERYLRETETMADLNRAVKEAMRSESPTLVRPPAQSRSGN
jgi:hypothetical protein